MSEVKVFLEDWAGVKVLLGLEDRLCELCHGLGWVTSDGKSERCPTCNGTGWRNLDEAMDWLRARLQDWRGRREGSGIKPCHE